MLDENSRYDVFAEATTVIMARDKSNHPVCFSKRSGPPERTGCDLYQEEALIYKGDYYVKMYITLPTPQEEAEYRRSLQRDEAARRARLLGVSVADLKLLRGSHS